MLSAHLFSRENLNNLVNLCQYSVCFLTRNSVWYLNFGHEVNVAEMNFRHAFPTGEFIDTKCHIAYQSFGHAMVLVGYTERILRVKNR